MIGIFNGRERTLGGTIPGVYVKLLVDFRSHLHLFKGAPLAVFLAIALHSDEHGWSFPSYRLLNRETGYGKDTIARALAALCKLKIDEHRVLLRYQPYDSKAKRWLNNRYLIFPSPDEVAKYETDQCRHFLDTGNQDTGNQDTGNQDTGNADTKKNQAQLKPTEPKPAKPKPATTTAAAVVFCSIHNVPMQLRQKDGDEWYSHRLSDGSWCKGSLGDQPGQGRRQSKAERERYANWGGANV
jgi:hypothetical protein